MVQKRVIKQILKPRIKRVHKKQLGRVLIIAGSKNMSGAGLLTARAALRAGAGLVTIAYPKCLANVYRKSLPEALSLILPQTKAGTISLDAFSLIIKELPKNDLVALGPGLTRNKSTEALVVKFVKNINKPLIIDADGLNALADLKKAGLLKLRSRLTVLTPHQGEMARLTGLSVRNIGSRRVKVASDYARLWRCFIVLKGFNTVVASEEEKKYINKTGGPSLATPGSGDVLAGILSALVSQNLNDSFSAICCGVFLHGRAGDLASRRLGEHSVIATDLIDDLPRAILKYCRP